MSLRRIVVLVAVALAAYSLGAAAQAPKKEEPKAAEKTFKGEVVSVNATAGEFVVKEMVKGKPVEMKFHVSADTKIEIDDMPVKLADLKTGESVTVTYETKEGKHTAKQVKHHKKVTE